MLSTGSKNIYKKNKHYVCLIFSPRNYCEHKMLLLFLTFDIIFLNIFFKSLKAYLMKFTLKKKVQFGLLLPLLLLAFGLIVFQFKNINSFVLGEIKESLRGQVQIMYQPMYDKYSLYKIGVIKSKDLAYSEGIKIVQNSKFGKESKRYFWLLDINESKVLAHPSKIIIRKKITSMSDSLDLKAFYKIKERLKSGKNNGFIEFKGIDFSSNKTISKLAYYTYFKEWNWILATEINFSEIEDKTKSVIFKFMIFFIIGIFILFLVVTYIIQKSAIGPLLAISSELADSSISIKKASEENLEVSNTMNEANTEQSSNLQETAASVDEISAMVQRNRDAAKDSSRIATENLKSVNDGRDSIKELIDSITEMSNTSESTSQKMKQNIDNIVQIQEIIKNIDSKTQVINDIVFQTKLLSFNASVEAARAGESGKGFAVVAEEVGNLAQMSGGASDEISSLINESMTKVKEIVNNITQTAESIVDETKGASEKSTVSANSCDKLFNTILESIQILTDRINEISTASDEQSRGVEEISTAMKRLDTLSHNSTQISKDTKKSAEGLTINSKELDDIVENISNIING